MNAVIPRFKRCMRLIIDGNASDLAPPWISQANNNLLGCLPRRRLNRRLYKSFIRV